MLNVLLFRLHMLIPCQQHHIFKLISIYLYHDSTGTQILFTFDHYTCVKGLFKILIAPPSVILSLRHTIVSLLPFLCDELSGGWVGEWWSWRELSDIPTHFYFESFSHRYYCVKVCCDMGQIYEIKRPETHGLKLSLEAIISLPWLRLNNLHKVQLFNKGDNSCDELSDCDEMTVWHDETTVWQSDWQPTIK